MDAIDQLQEREERLEKLTAAARGIVYQKESASECVECGYLISSERQIALPGVQTCVDCQELLDQMGK